MKVAVLGFDGPLARATRAELERRGHTEAAVDLASLAGWSPAGVICEILNEDGTMARVPDLIRFCERHDLVMTTIADLARYCFEVDCDGALDRVPPSWPPPVNPEVSHQKRTIA